MVRKYCMEQTKMEIKNLIGQYKFLKPHLVSTFLRTFTTIDKFRDAEIITKNGNSEIDKDIRNVKNYALCKNKGLTEAHWHNLICVGIGKIALQYFEERNINYMPSKIETITLLKYSEGGFYKPHIDSGKIHRELSVIVFLNNDYEGGHLQFFKPNSKDLILDIKPEPGKIVLWPSNFLFPHQATPVTKGTRYTLVSWMI